jgi:hypothetical protein
MRSALDMFNQNLTRVRHMHGLHEALSVRLAPIVDLTDILRSEVVMAVSALDHYVHEIVRRGMIECWTGIREQTEAFKRFSLSISVAKNLSNPMAAVSALDVHIREKHNYQSFQHPDKISEAIKLFSPVIIWDEVGARLNKKAKDVKIELNLIVDRRNKMVHESDINPLYVGQRWEIERENVESMIGTVENIVHTIHDIVV